MWIQVRQDQGVSVRLNIPQACINANRIWVETNHPTAMLMQMKFCVFLECSFSGWKFQVVHENLYIMKPLPSSTRCHKPASPVSDQFSRFP
jgi:hypothetical protein